MARFLTVDGSLDIQNTVIPFGKSADLYCSSVRHFFLHRAENLFPDQLCTDLTLRLIGYAVIRKEMRTFGSILPHLCKENIKPVSVLCRNGYNGIKIKYLRPGCNNGKKTFLFNRINLVDYQDGRNSALPNSVQ